MTQVSKIGNVFRSYRTHIAVVVVLLLGLLLALSGMGAEEWLLTFIRGLAAGALIFLVASGLSLIFGLLDVLNLAHGELFMIGAYVGWTVFIRPDTFLDVLPLVCFLAVGFLLLPALRPWVARLPVASTAGRVWAGLGLAVGLLIVFFALRAYPITIWDPGVYAESPVTLSLAFSQGQLVLPEPVAFAVTPLLVIGGLLLGSVLLAASAAGLAHARGHAAAPTGRRPWLYAGALLALGVVLFVFNSALTDFLFNLGSTARFFIAIAVASGTGFLLGALIETTFIRPLYSRPLYQIMMTLGLSFIGIELVRAIWGQPEFTMPKPALFDGGGDACPATSLGAWLEHHCSTILLFDSRIRVYNEVFIILVGLVVLVAIWLLLRRTRLGMIIRAGVQDSDMVQALGIDVRRVFTLVFGLGAGLAALGGILAAPSIGLATDMGTRFLLLALIALAIGGLTSFPGAAVGSLLVGLMQQFIIKYGQIGINIPFFEEPFKPTPPLVPASVILLMVIVLLLLPNGLLGRKE